MEPFSTDFNECGKHKQALNFTPVEPQRTFEADQHVIRYMLIFSQ